MFDLGDESKLATRALPPYDTVYYFDQLIDHDDPSKGTFQQRYWHTSEYYQPGGPIVFMNAGEVNAAPYYGYVTNSTINGVLAQQYHGSAIVLEHRFFGESNPYPNLNADSLKLHTIAQAIEDNVYFAQNVVLPQDNGSELGPDKAPWVLIGGSYPGALVSWTMAAHPNVFWIGYSSSGVVQAQVDFWQYYEPIRENMPQNCSEDVKAVISHVDDVFFGSDSAAQAAVRSSFGLNFTSNDYVAGALRWDLWTWQDMQPNTGPAAAFYQFCDSLEVKDGVSASASGWGLDNAFAAWGNHFRTTYVDFGEQIYLISSCIPPTSDSGRLYCVGRHRADYPVDDANRSWFWLVCNELGFSQGGPPVGQGGIVSRLNTVQLYMADCVSTYPEAFSEPPTPSADAVNKAYGGWGVQNDRLFFANGKRDPWREATVSALNSTATSTDRQPIGLSNGFHASDLVMRLAAPDQTIVDVQNSFLEYAGEWLAEFS
ncbi:peptidase S28 [Mucidula mucida]|nr:peptidase S28 [Mucidula mucida]